MVMVGGWKDLDSLSISLNMAAPLARKIRVGESLKHREYDFTERHAEEDRRLLVTRSIRLSLALSPRLWINCKRKDSHANHTSKRDI